MPFVFAFLSFLLGLAGVRCLIYWMSVSILAGRGRMLVGDAHFREYRQYVEFKKPAPYLLWGGIVLLFLALLVAIFTPLAPSPRALAVLHI